MANTFREEAIRSNGTVVDTSRRTDLAGQTVKQQTGAGTYTVTYNNEGYMQNAISDAYVAKYGMGNGASDGRIADVNRDKANAMGNVDSTYGNMIDSVDGFYQKQIDAVGQYAETQAKNQQEQTDFAIEQIEQQKDQAKKDYTKEQSGAYVDWQKQSNEYGANAEAMAAQGMGGTGYSESSQVSMYNQYQSRVATARESYNRAVLNYDNAIKDARLQNNAALAEIAFNALQTQLELSLEGFQYKNNLIQEKTKMEMEVDNQYWNRYTDVLDQINTENALAEETRQFNEKMAEERRQYNESMALEKAQLAEEKRQFNAQQAAKVASASYTSSKSGGSSRSSKSRGSSSSSYSKNRSSTTSKSYSGGAKKTTTKSSSGSPTVDMDSVLALGYGPISASRLSQLESQGIIESYQSGNKIKFRKSAYAFKQSMLLK